MMKQSKDWEEEFYKQFYLPLLQSNSDGGYDARPYIHDFIRNLLSEERAKRQEEIKFIADIQRVIIMDKIKEELLKDAGQHFETSETPQITHFWAEVIDWLDNLFTYDVVKPKLYIHKGNRLEEVEKL